MITSNNISFSSNITSQPTVKTKPAWAYTRSDFRPEGKKWDICYSYQYPYGVLCNFTPSHFHFDGVEINSMEGFLQSLKVKDTAAQEKVCKLPGFIAKKVGNYLKRSEKFDREHLFWKGKEYNRYSPEYQKLLQRAYNAKYSQDSEFRAVLNSSKGYTLTHDIGKTDPNDTILTEKEFIDNLNRLRDGKINVSLPQYFKSKIENVLNPNYNASKVKKSLKNIQTTVINDKLLCGENLFTDDNIKYLNKKFGIKNVIDVNAEPDLEVFRKNICKAYNVGYLNVKENPDFETVQKLTEMYNKKGNSYINSDERLNTNLPVALNYLFNPKTTFPDAILFGTPRKQFIKHLKNIKNQFTPEQISKMGNDSTFEDTFAEKIKILADINQ
jgi:predicted NAD-dependent protein-ADP-ribosyltransferase YbiA (DUF1768 family)